MRCIGPRPGCIEAWSQHAACARAQALGPLPSTGYRVPGRLGPRIRQLQGARWLSEACRRDHVGETLKVDRPGIESARDACMPAPNMAQLAFQSPAERHAPFRGHDAPTASGLIPAKRPNPAPTSRRRRHPQPHPRRRPRRRHPPLPTSCLRWSSMTRLRRIRKYRR